MLNNLSELDNHSVRFANLVADLVYGDSCMYCAGVLNISLS